MTTTKKTTTKNEISPLDLLLALNGDTSAPAAALDAAAEISADVAERARFEKGRGRPVCYPATGEKCQRCKGRGVIDAFRHVANGTCFRCEGWGVERVG